MIEEKKEIEQVDWGNYNLINRMLLDYLSEIINLSQSDITKFLIFIQELYLKDAYTQIEPTNLLLLQYIYSNMLDSIEIPLYKDIIKSILSYHIVRISEKMHIEQPQTAFAEQDTQTSFNI